MRFTLRCKQRLTHANVSLGKQGRDLGLPVHQFFEQIRRVLQPEGVTKVLEQPRCEMIRDDGRHLNFWIGSQLPPFEEQLLRRLQEPHLRLGSRDRIQLSKSCKPIAGIVGVSYCPQECRQVSLLPDCRRSLVTFAAQVHNVSIHSTGDFDLDANVHATECVEAAVGALAHFPRAAFTSKPGAILLDCECQAVEIRRQGGRR